MVAPPDERNRLIARWERNVEATSRRPCPWPSDRGTDLATDLATDGVARRFARVVGGVRRDDVPRMIQAIA